MSFYDRLASDYDRIVDVRRREAAAERFAGRLVADFGVRRALEVACGTGLYARALAGAGVEVVASDLSGEMLAEARQAGGGGVTWIEAPMERIADHVADGFDAVLCMGNSLPHLLEDDVLAEALAGFARLLREGGLAVMQLLNYDRVLARGERFVGASRRGQTEYVRFYDFGADRLRFNILELRWQGERVEHALHATELRPYRAGELAEALSSAGFGRIERFSGLGLEPFDARDSDGLLIVAHRGGGRPGHFADG